MKLLVVQVVTNRKFSNLFKALANDSSAQGRTLLDYTNFFSPHDYKSNDEAIYKPL